MKKLILLFCCSFSSLVMAQSGKHNPNDRIHSLNWDVIGSLRYDLNEQNALMPRFSEMLIRFEGQDFDLVGYLIPIKTGRSQSRFLLSPLPINQCYFCGQNGIPPMIMIEMVQPVTYTVKPVHIQGTLCLERVDSRFAPPLILRKSKEVN